MLAKAFITLGLAAMVLARPQFITFKDGKVGVNFGGYHASAGLGGLLTGDAAAGGLQAEAGTPWGARAAAGLGGDTAGGQGRASGGLYAGAQSGWGHSAGARLAGSTSAQGSSGVAVAGAKGVGVVKTVEVEAPPSVAVTNTINKNVELVETAAPVKQVQVVQETVPAAHAGFTITKTVQPVAYVTKTVQTVPAVRTRVESVEVEKPAVEAPKKEVVQEVVQEVPQYYNTVYLRKRFRPRHFYKHFGYYPAVQYASNVEVAPVVQPQVVKQVSVPVVRTEVVKQVQPVQYVKQVEVQPVQVVKQVQTAPVQSQVVKEVSYPAQGGFAAQGGLSFGGSKTFFDDIFNIPISTLGAVNQFLNNKAAGASGSVQFSKQVYG